MVMDGGVGGWKASPLSALDLVQRSMLPTSDHRAVLSYLWATVEWTARWLGMMESVAEEAAAL